MRTEIDGYQINYRITGEKNRDTIVILQGWGTKLEYYDSIASCLNDRYRVVQFDFPGFGGSEEPREAWNVDAFASFFCRLMERLQIESASLLGHSYGGRVIIKLAARENIPFEIKNIVLVDSAGIMPKRSARQKMKIKKYKALKKFLNLKWVYSLFPELIDEWRNRQGSEDYRNASPVMKQCMVMAVNEDLTEILPKIKQDTLLIWGDQDTATPISDAKLMEEKIPNAGLAEIKGAGHFCFIDQPVIFRNILNAYFR